MKTLKNIKMPDWISIGFDGAAFSASCRPDGEYGRGASVKFQQAKGHTDILIGSREMSLRWVQLRWNQSLPEKSRILGDAWERGYGDLEWRGIAAGRFMPWYFLADAGEKIEGYGVMVRPSAMCFWQADNEGITLYLDMRCGGDGVELGERIIKAASIVSCEFTECTAFEAAREFCHTMCEDPILPEYPIYGSNNWYYAYGNSSEEEILNDTDYLLKLTNGVSNAPYMVIDDCWQEHHRLDEYNGGPWRKGNAKFPDMKALAEKITEKGARPGIWVRLLLNEDEKIPDEWRISHSGCLDPSHPDALEYIKEDVKRICDWGYTLIKHDFSTFDLFGRWGFEMNPLITRNGWHFYDRTKTSAEVVKMLYQAILDSAKETNAIILGCNTIGHLGAGLMHMHRTGDDTSGKDWERTRRIGINTLAFRLPQHRTFFDVDADCVGIAGNILWEKNRQWAEVIAASGTSLFVSAKPGVLSSGEERELNQIMKDASKQNRHAIPADWQYTDCPQEWEEDSRITRYHWFEKKGIVIHSEFKWQIDESDGIRWE